VCVKFGCKSGSGYRTFGKTAQGGHFLWDTLYNETITGFSNAVREKNCCAQLAGSTLQ